MLRPSTCIREKHILLQVFKDFTYTCDLWGPGIFCRKQIEAKLFQNKITLSVSRILVLFYMQNQNTVTLLSDFGLRSLLINAKRGYQTSCLHFAFEMKAQLTLVMNVDSSA